jgi:hypothetical protein
MPRRALRVLNAALRPVPLERVPLPVAASADRVGLPAAPAAATQSDFGVTPTPRTNHMIMRGDYWDVAFGGASGMLQDCRGLRYIAVLIRDAAAERGPVHARELVGRATGPADVAIELEAKDYVLDATAETQLTKRVEEIGFERQRASAARDFDRMAELETEYEQIAEALSTGRGKGSGRRAAFNGEAEKARKAVAKAITEAIVRMSGHPKLVPLGQHLTAAIRKGQWLSYSGTSAWQVDFQPPLPSK